MKKFFLAFSILLCFSFSWAEESSSKPTHDRTKQTGDDKGEAMVKDGAGANATGIVDCPRCKAHALDGRLYDNTNASVRTDGSGTIVNDKEGNVKANDATK